MSQKESLMWLKDRIDIEIIILTYSTSIDLRNFELFKSIFHDEINVYFSSLGAGKSSVMTKEVFCKRLLDVVHEYDTKKHQLTNFVIDVEKDEAGCVAYMESDYSNSSDSEDLFQSIGGYYTFLLKRIDSNWKISSLKLTLTWTEEEMKRYELTAQQIMLKESLV